MRIVDDYQFITHQLLTPTCRIIKSVAFVGGGGHWWAITHFNNYSDYWVPRWEVIDENATDNDTGKVGYARIACKQPLPEIGDIRLNDAKADLKLNLKRIESFA